ncbi:MAG: bifunctional 5,10-methylenetetrahydrofolate dehydrogenase/5,10-methenyltetrahydrofolate cyclohydrolase [Candidatus Saccharimonadales bacterium]
MTKILSGSEIAEFIKERQARQVRALRQADHVAPTLAIVKATDSSPVIEAYVRMKQRYAADILIDTVIETVDDNDMPAVLEKLSSDPSIHGIIVQLPLTDPTKTDEIVNLIAPSKDVDGLGKDAAFDSATAEAINWLLVGYGVELKTKKIVIIGNGRLVGAPLYKIWQSGGYNVTIVGRDDDLKASLVSADIIVTATGSAGLLTSDMVAIGAVVVDAGTASEDGVIVGDVDQSVRAREDLTITPEKGGVGPLTITALFDHVIRAATESAKTTLD